MNEFSLIEKYFAPLAKGFPGSLALEDDAALVTVPVEKQLVLTKDVITAGVHFLADDPPEAIARKLVRVNISDLAAMRALPYAIMLATVFPDVIKEDWIARFAQGLSEDCREFGISLIGGDTTATPGPLTLSLTALGLVEPGKEMRRSGAQAGDFLCVSGTLGDAALGLHIAQGRLGRVARETSDFLLDRYRIPQPRITLSLRLGDCVTAGMDLSDGLPGDARHLCKASGLGAAIDMDALPLSSAACDVLSAYPDLWPRVANGGDDYELLVAIPPEKMKKAETIAAQLGMRLTRIGRMTEASTVTFYRREEGDVTVSLSGYQHFRDPCRREEGS